MQERRSKRDVLAAFSLTAIVSVAILLAGSKGKGRLGVTSAIFPAVSSVAAAERNPWALAAEQVTADRGEAATGRQAQVAVPAQLRHSDDPRRFLATQVAEWREHEVATPRDFAGLANLIHSGELVEVAPVTDNYILFGVGALADGEPFTYYDKSSGQSVPLYDDAELAQAYARLEQTSVSLRAETDALRHELDSVGKNERARRTSLRAQLVRPERALKAAREQAALLHSYYDTTERRSALADERAALAALAGDFSGRDYDIADAAARKVMKVRMLSHLRPAALAVLQELAGSYRAKFNRPLPITSLVRPDEYQRELGKTNANATRIDIPPHSTGLAFDILYRYMTAEEQEFVMADIARLRDAGRVEALRENRDHFHVFAFIDGQRPAEDAIRASLDRSPAPRTKTPATRRTAEGRSKHESKKIGRKETVKKAGKPAGRKRK
jgi:hypothetical protein